MKKTFKVSGMMCAHCEQRVSNALTQMDGMKQVQADAKAGTVVCEFDEAKITADQIRTTIEEVGYDVVEG